MNTTLNRLDDATTVGTVTLNAADLDRLLGYYHHGVGLDVLQQEGDRALLGRKHADGGAEALLEIVHAPGLSRAAVGSAGLFHTAILFEQRSSLAAAVYSVARKYPGSFTGSSDHLVSEAFYFDDPEGNGVELYWDKPRESWTWKGDQVDMATLPLDPNLFLQQHLTEAGAEATDGGPATIGHVHLQVGDIPTAEQFYHGILGFDITIRYGSQALFLSAGGYHHHLGMNTWNSSGAGRRAPALGLGQLSIVVPSTDAVLALTERLDAAGIEHGDDGRRLRFDDPWGNQVLVRLDEAVPALS